MNKDYFIIIKDGASTTMLDVREISSITSDYLASIDEMYFTVSMKNGDKIKTKENVLDILDEHNKFLQSKINN
ncbi:hypothetical protein JOE44_001936 [Chryseobacterium sp. PvR013]|uniref:hypothetical protein n=1 Tax=Chryseobacterium sp. PvR013 TaxID=2806595 RepID=UPI001AE98728|nr:hypothetical protein [Chryseobacterium sp. PvR013]MBP1165052.1 hypothetical protein [Chryseobacterium sp. PvR013]